MANNEAIGSQGICFIQLYENPKVLLNGDVIFKIYAPGAETVEVAGMSKDTGFGSDKYELEPVGDGNFQRVVRGLRPGFHYYTYIVDGMNVLNPACPIYHGWAKASNGLEVPDPELDFYHMKDVPHGDVRHQWYKSNITGRQRHIMVYTPPSYDFDSTRRYPALYLQHGSGESETSWMWQGKINNIMDNLLAESLTEEMLIVMDYGYAYKEGYEPGTEGPNKDNIFEEVVVRELVPFIDSKFRTCSDREHRAIAGLSMGGGQAARIGLGNIDVFSSVGLFSAGGLQNIDTAESFGGILMDSSRFNSCMKLLFIACGTSDFLYEHSEQLHQRLLESGTRHEWFTCPGTHEWQAWRRHAYMFLPMLFRGA